MRAYAQPSTKPKQGGTEPKRGASELMAARARKVQTPDHGAAAWLQRRVEGREPVQRRPIDFGYGDLVGAAGALRSRGAVVQTKLTVGHTDDPLEHEADRVADSVLRMPSPVGVQRKCAACAEEEREGMPRVQRKCAACAAEQSPRVQRAAVPRSAAQDAPPIIEQNLRSATGAPLDAGVRAFFEPRFGRDFSDVRVHAGASADTSARAVNAEAYTVGRDIFFREGAFEPNADRGRRLLAHELTHVVQQGAAPPALDGGAQDAISPAMAQAQRQEADAPVQRPCPWSLAALRANPVGWKPYYGDPSVFHCGYTGFVEDRAPAPGAPMNECFYDERGALVTEDSAFAGCRGTPDDYDASGGLLDKILHGTIDSGGIVRAGGPAFIDSRLHDAAEWFSGLDCSIRRLYGVPC